jgi:hypothetical protein
MALLRRDRMAKSFKDEKGREWIPRIDADVIFRYEARTGVNIFKAMAESGAVGAIPGARELLVLLWCSVRKDADRLQVTEEDFRQSLRGQAMIDATEVVMEEAFNFFPWLRLIAEAARKINRPNPGSDKTSSSTELSPESPTP